LDLNKFPSYNQFTIKGFGLEQERRGGGFEMEEERSSAGFRLEQERSGSCLRGEERKSGAGLGSIFLFCVFWNKV